MLRVWDTGVGIAPELQPRIFDLFTQADRTLDRSQGGLGIGLRLVQKLVEMHGGTVEAHKCGIARYPFRRPPQPFMILRYATNKFGEPICGGRINPGKQGDKLIAAANA